VSTVGFKEIVYTTFSGKVGSFTTESLKLRDDEDPYGRAKETVMKEQQIMRMRKELEALKARCAARRRWRRSREELCGATRQRRQRR
jgi:hypothetical protein